MCLKDLLDGKHSDWIILFGCGYRLYNSVLQFIILAFSVIISKCCFCDFSDFLFLLAVVFHIVREVADQYILIQQY